MVTVPFALQDGLVGPGQIADEGQQQAPGVFGGGRDAAQEVCFALQAQDGNPAFGSQGCVEVIETGRGADQGFQPRSRVENFPVDLGAETDNQHVNFT